MTPPEAPQSGQLAEAGEDPPAVSLRLHTIRQRRDFQRAARARSVAMPGFILQMRQRNPEEPAPHPHALRVGFTCSRKVGNAVARNRAKRRLREVARLQLPTLGQPGADYVLIGRRGATAELPFTQLQTDFARALAILHGEKS
ncbi:MAG: ribonuclease P protein component [Rhodobacteraceae bacterium]|nr:ribonuclease P protein component [Paracoccaceae bacterium]MBO29711.1 ribonuclease P protein component [Paracoccaceae bacterium]